jgi:Xaa-Pro aminopeptidase
LCNLDEMLIMFRLFSFFLFLPIFPLQSQPEVQPDLDVSFHKERRNMVLDKLPPNSISVIFSSPIRNRSNDVDHPYHQNPNFYYLTGFQEAHSVLVLLGSPTEIEGSSSQEILFVRDRDPYYALWEGDIKGAEATQREFGINKVLSTTRFSSFLSSLQGVNTIYHFPLLNDVRDHPRNTFDLFALQTAFTEFIVDQTELSKPEDSVVTIDQEVLPAIVGSLREIKTEQEIAILKQAVAMSAIGQIEVMKAIHPEISERELQGIHEFVFKKYGAKHVGYPSIVGAGAHGCVLHYTANTSDQVGNQLVLMDVGAEFQNYTADVTRTIPANGKFTKEQAEIYNLVLAAQNAGIEASVVGASFSDPHRVARSVIQHGLTELGIIQTAEEVRTYFPHGTSHYIGLDVHDPGTYGPLQANSVITVEPGIYIPPNSPCDPKWWGIAIRIEDDILITQSGPVNLSAAAPREIDKIEKMIAQDSPLDEFVLPVLDSIID